MHTDRGSPNLTLRLALEDELKIRLVQTWEVRHRGHLFQGAISRIRQAGGVVGASTAEDRKNSMDFKDTAYRLVVTAYNLEPTNFPASADGRVAIAGKPLSGPLVAPAAIAVCTIDPRRSHPLLPNLQLRSRSSRSLTTSHRVAFHQFVKVELGQGLAS